MSEGYAPLVKSRAQDKLLDQLHLRRPCARHAAYRRALQPLPQRTNDQQDGSWLRTIIKNSSNAQLVGSIGKGFAFVEHRTGLKLFSIQDYRVIYGHKILASINAHVENSFVREIASRAHLQRALSITIILNLKPRSNPTNRVPEVASNFSTLQALSLEAHGSAPQGKKNRRRHQECYDYCESQPVNGATKGESLGR